MKDTRATFVVEALRLLEEAGVQGLTTRAVCSRVGVTAPSLFHHFGDLFGLVDTAISAGLERFLRLRNTQRPFSDPGEGLLSAWDNYVAFAGAHPKLYAALAAQYASGTPIPAAQLIRAPLDAKLEQLAAAGRLAVSPKAAAEITWSTAHAAAMLIISRHPARPTDEAIARLRASVEQIVREARGRRQMEVLR